MSYVVVNQCNSLKGRIPLPGSKSQCIRAMILATLAHGQSTVTHWLHSEDTETVVQACCALGAQVTPTSHTLTINSKGLPFTSHPRDVFTGNSGITTLFMLPLLGLTTNGKVPIFFDCGAQMKGRPIKPLVDALNQLGMHIRYAEREGQCPLWVSQELKGGRVTIDGTHSQYVSALLISLPCAPKDSIIKVKQLNERPYVYMTLQFLNRHNIKYHHQSFDREDIFQIQGNQHYQTMNYHIQGDFSSASCVIAASVLLPGDVELQGLNFKDSQGDRRMIEILREMGAHIQIEKEIIRIRGNLPLTGISIDANDIPDLLPALAVLGTKAQGKTEIYNVKHARIKETDRIRSMAEGLKQMGAHIEERTDGMIIHSSALHGAYVKGYNDHRTVMALAVAGLIASGTTIITHGEAINKTYPQFITALNTLGAHIALQNVQ